MVFNGTTTSNNLPKQSESRVAHVRPHARDSKDTYPLPDGREMVKQCFWLNRTYIEDIVRENTVLAVAAEKSSQYVTKDLK